MPAFNSRRTQGLRPFRSDAQSTLRDELENLLSNFLGEDTGGLQTLFTPCIDLSETEDAFEIEMDLPGMKPADIEVEMRGDTLVVCGDRKTENESGQKSSHRVERQMGRFCRAIQLPGESKTEEISAEYKDGTLCVRVPKAESSQAHKIEVKSGNGTTASAGESGSRTADQKTEEARDT